MLIFFVTDGLGRRNILQQKIKRDLRRKNMVKAKDRNSPAVLSSSYRAIKTRATEGETGAECGCAGWNVRCAQCHQIYSKEKLGKERSMVGWL